jgi:hypothetical protein
MVSNRKISANKANARASTGPRTRAGKSRSSRNALRHGLSLSIFDDPDLSPAVSQLALIISGSDSSSELVQLARGVVVAQLDLVRIRKARCQLESRAAPSSGGDIPLDDGSDVAHEDAFANLAPRLLALARYERRALSRRKFAIREFESARSAAQTNCR